MVEKKIAKYPKKETEFEKEGTYFHEIQNVQLVFYKSLKSFISVFKNVDNSTSIKI